MQFSLRHSSDSYVADRATFTINANSTLSLTVPSGSYKLVSGSSASPAARVDEYSLTSIKFNGSASWTALSTVLDEDKLAMGTSYELPVIGTVAVPAWVTSPEGLCFVLGFALMAGVRLFRAGLKWMKRAGSERYD